MLFRICAVLCNFYPRPPRGGRPVCFAAGRVSVSISIHALREEGDSSPIFKKVAILNFYPRPPRGGRRGVCAGIVAPELISIHALREEGDRGSRCSRASGRYFYPRPPRGGRPSGATSPPWSIPFLSTPSARRATIEDTHTGLLQPISIHALREEGDSPTTAHTSPGRYFYPRPPRGGRPSAPATSTAATHFYPRPPRGGRRRCSAAAGHPPDFYPRPPRGGRQQSSSDGRHSA